MNLIKFQNNKIPEISKNVDLFDDDLKDIVKSMFDIIHKNNGIGLAAIQVGIPKRIVIAEIENGNKIVAINPKIIWKSEKFSEMKESNLSLSSDIKVLIKRSAEIKIKYQDIDGKWQELKATGILATCLQHEIEQLDGITILDHKNSK